MLRDLVVVFVILFVLAVFATLLIPARCYAPELANQAACRANLKGIGTAIAMYRGDNKDTAFPLLWTTGRPEANIAESDSAGTIEELKAKLTGREAAMQNLWLLIDKGLVTEEAFGCPSDEEYLPREFTDDADKAANKVGWQSSANFSYGMHFPYESTTVNGETVENPAPLGPELSGSFVIMADKNPSPNNEPATGVGPQKTPSNHKEHGESFLMYSGQVNWKSSMEDSDVNGDDIYTTEPLNNANPATPADLDDQYIIRHPVLGK
jgi:hypothetical protein